MSSLEISVSAGGSSPVVVALAGEADLASVARLHEVLNAQLAGRTTHLTIDLSNLRYADSEAIRALMMAALTLRDRGGGLVLWRPDESMVGMLRLLGIEQLFTILGQKQTRTEPDCGEREQKSAA
jgi:anti-anti-sigma factor